MKETGCIPTLLGIKKDCKSFRKLALSKNERRSYFVIEIIKDHPRQFTNLQLKHLNLFRTASHLHRQGKILL